MGFWSQLKRTFRSGQHDKDIEDELEYHLAMKEQNGCEARAARLQFGNPTKLKEEARAEGVLPWLESSFRDARYALRQMHKAPLFTLVLVFSLALGIGANSAIFSLVNAALLRSLSVPKPESLRLVEWTNNGFPEALCNMLSGDSKGDEHRFQGSSIAVRVYRELATQQHGFTSLIGFSDPSMAAVVVNKQPAEQFRLQYVSANFFSGLEVKLQLGRPFLLSDDRVGQPPVVIISDRFWRSQLARRSDVLGQVLRINNVPVEIAGVAAPGFFGLQIGEWVDLYTPLAAEVALSPRAKLDQSFGDTDRYWWVRMMARLRPEASESQAMQELATLFQRLAVPSGVHIEAEKIPKLIALPGERGVDPMRADESRALWILFLLVGLILLIVCANVANLLLSRAIVRQRESAVCLALGAARFRLFRQYFTESLLLAVCGGAAGLLLSYLLAHALHSFIRADMNIGGFDLRANGQVLGFTCAVSLGTAVLCGIAPAWMLARASVHEALKANNRTILTGHLRLPRVLVVAQIALSFTVLVVAGLLGRSLTNLRNVGLGFNQTNLVYASVNPWSAGYQPEQVSGYVKRLRSALASIPGVLRVATVELRPLSGDVNMSVINLPGRPFNISSDAVVVNRVSDGFFETLGVPLVAGRTFAPGDMGKDSDAVIVDDLFVRRFYGGRNPIGEQFGTGPKPTNRYRIIGVVKNSRYYSLREASRPAMFLPSATASHPGWRVNFVLRAAIGTGQLSRAFRQVSTTIDPSVPVIAIETQTELIDALLRSERLLSIFSGAFGLLALVLSSIGLLGLLAYMVARRRNEIGVRMALGASRQRVAGMVVRDAFLLLVIGLAAGVPGAVFLGRMLKHTLFNLRPADPTIGLLALATMVVVAALSSWIPAMRAAHIDPMRTLRDE
jgi:predicted permease